MLNVFLYPAGLHWHCPTSDSATGIIFQVGRLRGSVHGAFKFAPSRHSRDIKWPGLASMGGRFLRFLAPGRPARHTLALTQARAVPRV